MDIKKLVFEALNNAKENGYEPEKESVEYWANDLIDYDADLENCEPEELTPYIEEWRKFNEH